MNLSQREVELLRQVLLESDRVSRALDSQERSEYQNELVELLRRINN